MYNGSEGSKLRVPPQATGLRHAVPHSNFRFGSPTLRNPNTNTDYDDASRHHRPPNLAKTFYSDALATISTTAHTQCIFDADITANKTPSCAS